MARQANRSIGRKGGGFLNGLLGGLYSMSSAQANPDYLPAGTSGPAPEGGNLPFKGSGAFGGIKANQANQQFVMSDLLDNARSERDFNYKRKLMPLELEQQKALELQRQELSNQATEANLSKSGEQFFDYYSSLPANQQQLIQPGGPGQLPPSMADIGRLSISRYGANKPLVEIPTMAAEESNKLSVAQDPRTLSALKSEAIGKGLVTLGANNKANLDTNTVYSGGDTITNEEQIPLFDTRTVIDANSPTGTREEQFVKGYKTVRTPQIIAPGISSLKDMRMTPELVSSVSGGGGNNANQPGGEFMSVDMPPQSVQSANPLPPAQSSLTPQPNTRLEGLIPDMGRAVGSIFNQGVEDTSAGAQSMAEFLKLQELMSLINQGRKSLIRRGN